MSIVSVVFENDRYSPEEALDYLHSKGLKPIKEEEEEGRLVYYVNYKNLQFNVKEVPAGNGIYFTYVNYNSPVQKKIIPFRDNMIYTKDMLMLNNTPQSASDQYALSQEGDITFHPLTKEEKKAIDMHVRGKSLKASRELYDKIKKLKDLIVKKEMDKQSNADADFDDTLITKLKKEIDKSEPALRDQGLLSNGNSLELILEKLEDINKGINNTDKDLDTDDINVLIEILNRSSASFRRMQKGDKLKVLEVAEESLKKSPVYKSYEREPPSLKKRYLEHFANSAVASVLPHVRLMNVGVEQQLEPFLPGLQYAIPAIPPAPVNPGFAPPGYIPPPGPGRPPGPGLPPPPPPPPSFRPGIDPREIEDKSKSLNKTGRDLTKPTETVVNDDRFDNPFVRELKTRIASRKSEADKYMSTGDVITGRGRLIDYSKIFKRIPKTRLGKLKF